MFDELLKDELILPLLFPGQIDEELEEMDRRQTCPEIPMPHFYGYNNMDIIVVKLPCNYPQEGWKRDVFRLQVHLVAANLAVNRKKGKNGKMKLIFLSKCMPMMEIFRCNELKKREGDWWYYEPNMAKLAQKVSLPIGSCKLALTLREKGMLCTVLSSYISYLVIVSSSLLKINIS